MRHAILRGGMGGCMKIFTGNSNPKLAHDVAKNLGVDMGLADVDRFSDGEIKVAIGENVRGADCFIIQPTCPPTTNRNLMELLILIDALRRSSAGRITAVIPYFGYSRQDRQNSARMPITAKLCASLIDHAGADRAMSMDLHAGQIQGFFKCPVDNLYAKGVLVDAVQAYLLRERVESITVVSPDAGGTERARAYAKRLDARLAIIDKRRERANESQVMHIVGDVTDQICVIVDDMIDTAGTLCKGVDALMEAGALGAIAAITHPVLSGSAYITMGNTSGLKALVTTDTIPLVLRDTIPRNDENDGFKKVQIATIAPLLAEAIRRTHNEESISSLFR
jgi:ribose-phosphate pyrophosphokinase